MNIQESQPQNFTPCIIGLETELKEYIQDWKEEELISLMAECETILRSNKTRITELIQQGALKRFINFINGYNRKLKNNVISNLHYAQEISFQINQILIRKIDLTEKKIQGLENYTNLEFTEIKESIKNLSNEQFELKKKEHTLFEKIELLEWHQTLPNQKDKISGLHYYQLPKTKKILQIISDIFYLTKGTCSISDPLLESIIKNKELNLTEEKASISFIDFFEDIITHPDYLPLFIKNECYYQNLSPYGAIMVEIYNFYHKNQIPLFCTLNKEHKTPSEIGKDLFHSKWKIEHPIETIKNIKFLFHTLLNDLKTAYELYLEYEKPIKEFCEPNGTLSDSQTQKQSASSQSGTNKKTLLILSDNLYSIHNTKIEINNQIGCKAYKNFMDTLKSQDFYHEIENYKDSDIIAAIPDLLLEKLHTENQIQVQDPEKKIKWISLSEFFIYWFCKKNPIEGERKIILFEECNKRIQAIEYLQTKTEWKCNKKDLDIRANKFAQNILSDLQKQSFSVFDPNTIFFILLDCDATIADKNWNKSNINIKPFKWEENLQNIADLKN